MLNRRQIRIKVMQNIYELGASGSKNLDDADKKLKESCSSMHDLYILQYQLFVVIYNKAKKRGAALQQSHLSKNKEQSVLPLTDNVILKYLASSVALADAVESNRLSNWELDDEYANLFLDELLASEYYQDYVKQERSIATDKQLLIHLFKNIIAPNDKLYSYYEDTCISWTDDLPLVNTTILKELKKLNLDHNFTLTRLFKDVEDREFAKLLLHKTFLNNEELNEYVDKKTPKWDTDRIATIDGILMKMAICEFLKFPSIPVKVTINEYLEIAKEYSTERSSVFINGILDNLVKEFKDADKIQKIGRGLM